MNTLRISLTCEHCHNTQVRDIEIISYRRYSSGIAGYFEYNKQWWCIKLDGSDSGPVIFICRDCMKDFGMPFCGLDSADGKTFVYETATDSERVAYMARWERKDKEVNDNIIEWYREQTE